MKLQKSLYYFLLLFIFYGAQPSYAERVLGVGNGIEITDSDVEAFKKYLVPENIEPTQRALYKVILETEIFSLEAQKQGMDQQPDIQKRLSLLKKKVLAQLYAENYLKDRLKIDDNVIESYYLSHIDDFIIKPRLMLYRLVVTSMEKANKIFAKAQKAPESFPELVEHYSIDPGTKWKKGKMGIVAIDELRPEIQEALGEPSKGKVTKPLAIHGFYYIFWVKDVKPKHVIPLEKLKKEIRTKIAKEKRRKILQEHLGELQEKYGFKWNSIIKSIMSQRQQLGVK